MQHLIEWLKGYVKHRDIVAQAIKNIKETDDGFYVERTDTDQIYFVKLDLDEVTDFKGMLSHPGKNVFLVTLNNESNIKKVVKVWNILEPLANLKIIFINPLSKSDNKWLLSPHVHASICDPASLKNGLLSLGQNVGYITKEEIQKENI